MHPAEVNDRHALYLTCDDLAATMTELVARGAECESPVQESWGVRTKIHLPGGGRGLYQPIHPTAV